MTNLHASCSTHKGHSPDELDAAPLPSAAMDDQQGDRDEEDSHSDRVERGQGRTVDSSSPAIAVVNRAACAGGCTLP